MAGSVQHQTGIALTAPVDVVLNEENALQPDLIYVESVNPGRVRDGRFRGAPDLAVEIISPTSRTRDATLKAMRYALAGVREFWLADPDLRTIAVFELNGDQYVERLPGSEGVFDSGVLGGLRLDPATVFAAVDQAIREE